MCILKQNVVLITARVHNKLLITVILATDISYCCCETNMAIIIATLCVVALLHDMRNFILALHVCMYVAL